MARTVTTETTVYTYPELSDAAKETARQEWNQSLWQYGSMIESMQMIFEDMLTEAGWTDLADLTYSLYSQGGYPAWSGDLPTFVLGNRTYYVTVRDHHYYGPTVDVDEGDNGEPLTQEEHAAVVDAVKDHISDLSHKLYAAFVAEDEYQSSDEVMAETAEANGYEYTEDGHLA
jgi:hypothetical protein